MLESFSVTSDVSVQSGGILGGSGTVYSLTVRRGGIVAPGNSIGTLNVAGNISFEPGSRYVVEVGPNGQSDRIQSSGSATIGGGKVAVMLENSNNLLAESEVRSLLGQQYNILSAQQGVSGQFDAVAPNYLFLGTGMNYQPTGVTLSVGRNDTSFASVAKTPNERAMAPRCTAATGRRRTVTTTTWRHTATSSSARWRYAAVRATPGTASIPNGR